MKWTLTKDSLPPEGKQVIFDSGENGVTLASVKMNGKHPCLMGYESSGEEYYDDIEPYYRWLDESNDESEEIKKLKDALKQIINYTNPVSGIGVDGGVSIIAVNALTKN